MPARLPPHTPAGGLPPPGTPFCQDTGCSGDLFWARSVARRGRRQRHHPNPALPESEASRSTVNGSAP
jgi:hypothetical protein